MAILLTPQPNRRAFLAVLPAEASMGLLGGVKGVFHIITSPLLHGTEGVQLYRQ